MVSLAVLERKQTTLGWLQRLSSVFLKFGIAGHPARSLEGLSFLVLHGIFHPSNVSCGSVLFEEVKMSRISQVFVHKQAKMTLVNTLVDTQLIPVPRDVYGQGGHTPWGRMHHPL